MTANPSANDHLLPLSLEESAQFSLEDDEESTRHETDRQQRQGLLNPSNLNHASSSLMSSSSSTTPTSTTQRFPSWRDKSQQAQRDAAAASRLTDEIELDDADSGSDDLELLPPFSSTNGSGTSTTTKNAKRKLHKIFRCCSPHFVAPKCSIM